MTTQTQIIDLTSIYATSKIACAGWTIEVIHEQPLSGDKFSMRLRHPRHSRASGTPFLLDQAGGPAWSEDAVTFTDSFSGILKMFEHTLTGPVPTPKDSVLEVFSDLFEDARWDDQRRLMGGVTYKSRYGWFTFTNYDANGAVLPMFRFSLVAAGNCDPIEIWIAVPHDRPTEYSGGLDAPPALAAAHKCQSWVRLIREVQARVNEYLVPEFSVHTPNPDRIEFVFRGPISSRRSEWDVNGVIPALDQVLPPSESPIGLAYRVLSEHHPEVKIKVSPRGGAIVYDPDRGHPALSVRGSKCLINVHESTLVLVDLGVLGAAYCLARWWSHWAKLETYKHSVTTYAAREPGGDSKLWVRYELGDRAFEHRVDAMTGPEGSNEEWRNLMFGMMVGHRS